MTSKPTQNKNWEPFGWFTVDRFMSRLDLPNMVGLVVGSYSVFILKYLFWIHLIEKFMYFVLNLKIITGKKFAILQYVWLLLKILNQPRNYTFISKTIRNERVKKLKNFVRRHLEFCNLFLWRSKEIMSCMKMIVFVSYRSSKISIEFLFDMHLLVTYKNGYNVAIYCIILICWINYSL